VIMPDIARLTPAQVMELDRIMAWVIETCLVFGAQRSTAYKVAGVFGDALEQSWLGRHKN